MRQSAKVQPQSMIATVSGRVTPRVPQDQPSGNHCGSQDVGLGQCRYPVRYRVGDIDVRFRISRKEFLQALARAEAVWEAPTGRNLFQYDPRAPLAITAVYDHRQELVQKRQRLALIVRGSKSVLAVEQEQFRLEHKRFVSRVGPYNRRARYWNRRGGASAKQRRELDAEAGELMAFAQRLERMKELLNQRIEELNTSVRRFNDLASFSFVQGRYVPSEISIFAFENQTSLQLVLAHELGHALGIPHVNDPKSLMYFSTARNRTAALSNEDRSQLRKLCGF